MSDNPYGIFADLASEAGDTPDEFLADALAVMDIAYDDMEEIEFEFREQNKEQAAA